MLGHGESGAGIEREAEQGTILYASNLQVIVARSKRGSMIIKTHDN
jgi:hypothetical protein